MPIRNLAVTCLTSGILGSLALCTLGCQGNRSHDPPVHLNPNMDFQDRFDPQERNDFFEDGRAMRPPVAGTVARGLLKDDDHYWRGRGLDGRLAAVLPAQLELNADLVDRGHERFDIYCAPCHGESGMGDGFVTQHGSPFTVPPKNLHQDNLRAMPLGYFFDVATNGKGTMLGYAAQVPVEDRWAIAVWVRVLQKHGIEKGWTGDAPTQVAARPAGREAARPAGREAGGEK